MSVNLAFFSASRLARSALTRSPCRRNLNAWVNEVFENVACARPVLGSVTQPGICT